MSFPVAWLSKKGQGLMHAQNFQSKFPPKMSACTNSRANLRSVRISSFAVDKSVGWLLQVSPTPFSLHQHLPKVQHSLGSHEHLLRWLNNISTQRCRQLPAIKGGVERSVHATISLLVAISNAMHNGNKLLQIINAWLLQRLTT